MSSTVLSTKILSPAQKSLLLNAGLRLVEYNAITTEPIPFEVPRQHFDLLVFTSQNGVLAFSDRLEHNDVSNDSIRNTKITCCVGEKTKALLEKKGYRVMLMSPNAEQLAKSLIKDYGLQRLLLIVGSQRRDELPDALQKSKMDFTEIIAYTTKANPKKMEGTFDGILFFSPSGVESFCSANTLSGLSFCIGTTTAKTLKKYTNNYIIANKPTIENVLVQSIKQLANRY